MLIRPKINAVGTTVDSAGWSPSLTDNPESYGTPCMYANQKTNPFSERVDFIGVPVVPKPPDPAVGGLPGASKPFGWSTGLSDPLRFRQRFTGKTLVLPQVKMHGAYGPVGQSARQQRLENGVAALNAEYTPDSATVAAQFVGRGSPLEREIARQNGG